MPRSCCVPGCKINYYTNEKVSGFRFPKDEQRRLKWIKAIQREDFTPTSNTVVCAKHFEEHCIITNDSKTHPDGTTVKIKRATPTLTKDAFPTIFHNNPKDKSQKRVPSVPTKAAKKLLPAQTKPQKRKTKVYVQDRLEYLKCFEGDIISTFDEFVDNYISKLSKNWAFISSERCVSFLKVNCDDQPKIIVSFKVLKDLKVIVWYENTALDPKHFEWLLGSENKCDHWTKFENLLKYLSSYPDSAASEVVRHSVKSSRKSYWKVNLKMKRVQSGNCHGSLPST